MTIPSSSSASPPAQILWLCRRLSTSPQTPFKALLLFEEFMGTSGQNKVTPTSKKRVQGPLGVMITASVLAAQLAKDRDFEAIYRAALPLIGDKLPNETVITALKQTVEAIALMGAENALEITQQQPPGLPGLCSVNKTTAQFIEDLCINLCSQNMGIMQFIDLKICLKLLEVQCLANGGAHCGAVLRRGGLLAAAACIAAAFSIACPPEAAAESGPALLSSLEGVTGFPREVLMTQAQALLEKAMAE